MRLVDAVSLRSRRRKLRLFLDEVRPTAATTVLDVGADEVGFGHDGGQSGCGTHNFFEELYPWPGQITALGLHDGAGFRSHYPDIAYVSGDACALPFADQSFDVVFSNAVIEHVGDVERQRQFVAEALRVGRRVFLTTPNRWFPARGAHAAAARPLAAEGGLRPRLRAHRQGLGAREPPARQRRLPAPLPRPGPDRQPRSHARRDHMSERLPRIALAVLIVGLAVHNLAMAELWDAGIRGASLDVVAAWKDVLLAVALVVALLGARSVPLRLWADRLALAYAAFVLVYWLLPQSWLDGAATHRGQLFAARHDLIPVAAYFLGRLLVLTPQTWRRLSLALVGVAVGLTVWGLIDVYLVPLQWWRDSGVPDWFKDQLGLDYQGISGLPENWIFNTGDENNPIRRLVSGFLSPLATSYVLVIVLLYLVARRRTWWTVTAGAIAYAGLLWTHTRAAYLALALGLVVLAVAQRRFLPVALAVASLVIGVGFVKAFPHIGPSTSYTQSELEYLRDKGQQNPGVSDDPLSAGDASTSSHLRNLRDGIRTVDPPPARLRARERGRQRLADGRRDQGGRVDVHRDRRRERASPASPSSSPGWRPSCSRSGAGRPG